MLVVDYLSVLFWKTYSIFELLRLFSDKPLKLVLKVGSASDTPESIVSDHSERRHKHKKKKKKSKSSDKEKDRDRHHHKHDKHHHREKGDEDGTPLVEPSEEVRERLVEDVVPKTDERHTVEKENVVKETAEKKVSNILVSTFIRSYLGVSSILLK